MGTEARMKSLLSVSLVLLSSCSYSTTFNLSERNDDCTESSPFLIKNDSPNAKKPYLTLDVKKNSLSGGKLSKAGKAKKNQIWTWVNCGDGDFLNSLNLIKNGDWDAVVLQDQSQRPSFGSSYVYSYILPDVMTLVQTMRETNACTLPVFFQTWGKRDGDTGNCSPAPYDALCTFEGVQYALTQAYSTMAYVSQPAKVAPAGEAWRTYPGRNALFANDGSHATCSGTFLAACTIFEQIWGVPCSASTYSPVGDAAALKEQADAIVAGGSSWSWPSNGPPCPR